MIYKRIALLLLVASLSACSTMSSLIDKDSNTVDETPKNLKFEANEQTAESESAAAKMTPLSPSEILAQSLISQSDLYQSSKRVLSPDVKTKVVNALSYFNKGEFEKSEKSINLVLANELNLNSAVYVLAGDIALANNSPTEAIAHYIAALSLNDYSAKAANRLAMQLREQGEFAEAEKLYTQAINAQPSQAESYRNRAVLYDLYLDEKAKALQDYKAYSALLNYSLVAHEEPNKANLSQAKAIAAASKPLNDVQLKSLKTNIKLVKRWLSDLGRQVAALEKVNNNNMGGN
jgi:tetratricopeptide (TPR) repeat protein